MNPAMLSRPDPLFPGQYPDKVPSPQRTSPNKLQLPQPTAPNGCDAFLENHSELRKLEWHTGVVSAITSHKDCALVSCGGEGSIIRWDLASDDPLAAAPTARMPSQPRAVTISFSIDEGLVVFVGCNDGSVSKYEFDSMQQLPFVSASQGSPISGLCCAGPDLLISSLQNGTAESRQLPGGQLLVKFEGVHRQTVQSPVVFNQALFLACNDGRVSQWNLHTGSLMRLFEGHSDHVKVLLSCRLHTCTPMQCMHAVC